MKTKREQRKPLQDQEIVIILDALKHNSYNRNGSIYYPFIKFMFMTGVRNAEAIGLQVKKIDFAKKIITIDQAFARTLKGGNVKARKLKTTKANNVRYLPVNQEV